MITNQQWILQKRPEGRAKRSDFELRTLPVPEVEAGQCLIKILYMAMDPATRGWMSAAGGYTDPLPLGAPVMGVTIGKVVKSRNPKIAEGTIVAGVGQWARYMVVGPEQISPVRSGNIGVLSPMDTSTGHELPMYLHAMGTSGGTAYNGLLNIAGMKAGDKVLVSGAGGGVGSLAAQIARLKGASRVVGIAGGAAKCAEVVRDYGSDACIDYKSTDNISEAIRREFPEGLDVYFDNVGGPILEAALDNLALRARVAICGMISAYNDDKPSPGPRNLWNLLVKTARMEGFLVEYWFGTPDCEAGYREISGWIKSGQLKARLDIREQFERVPEVFDELFSGGNHGRLVIKLPD